MTSKDCGHHDDEKKRLYRRVFACILSVIIIILFVIFLVWIILQPTKPRFVLNDATVYSFNVSSSSSPTFLTSDIQVTISSKNRNNRIGVYYQKLDVYASYRNQQITLSTALPTTYQGHNDVVVWSPFVYGNAAPVAPYLAVSLSQDQMAGMVLVNIKINGRLKWKVGTWMSSTYHIYVNCPAYISFGSRNTGSPVGAGMKYQLVQSCSVDVGLGN